MSRTGLRSAWLPRPMAVAPPLDPNAMPGPRAPALCAADQPVLSQGPARQLRQARAHADARADEHRRRDAARTGTSRYWDENLLQGPPPLDPFPQVVGITRAPHVRGAGVRAGALVSAAGREGRPRRAARAVVPRRGRAARRRPGDRRGRAALAADPRATSRRARCKPVYRGDYRKPYRDDPAAAPRPAAARQLPHHDQPDRHARLPQPLRLLLPRRPTGCTCRTGCATSSRSSRSSGPTASRTPCSSTTTSARGRTTCASSAGRCGRSSRSGAPPSRST